MNCFYGSVIFVLVLLFSSCNRNVEESDHIVQDISQMDTITCASTSDTPLDSIIAKIEYIKLKSTEEHPVGGIDNLLITPEHIIVADRHLAKSIFIFDRQGKIQTIISRHGRGPQEYLSIFDVVLTPDQKRIAVLDNYGKKILYFDLAGNYLFHKVLSLYAGELKYLDDENILIVTYGMGTEDPGLASYPHNNDLLYCIDTTMQIKKSFMPNQFSKELSSYCTPNVKQFNNPGIELFDMKEQNIDNLKNKLYQAYTGKTLSAYDLFEEHQITGKYCRSHYAQALRKLCSENKLQATFTDNKNHSVSVLISKDCILKFA